MQRGQECPLEVQALRLLARLLENVRKERVERFFTQKHKRQFFHWPSITHSSILVNFPRCKQLFFVAAFQDLPTDAYKVE